MVETFTRWQDPTIEKLKEENNIFKSSFETMTKKYLVEKSKNEKAIEYNKEIIKAILTCSSYERDKIEDMLYHQEDILKGEEY